MKRITLYMVLAAVICAGLLVHHFRTSPQPLLIVPEVGKTQVVEEATSLKMVEVAVNDVAPETEAALAQFGLSGTGLVSISVVAQPRPPIILPNPMNRENNKQ